MAQNPDIVLIAGEAPRAIRSVTENRKQDLVSWLLRRGARADVSMSIATLRAMAIPHAIESPHAPEPAAAAQAANPAVFNELAQVFNLLGHPPPGPAFFGRWRRGKHLIRICASVLRIS